jgi:hypothetical protein
MSEASEVKRDGAKAQKNSGRGKLQKGDALWNGFVVDYKEYSKSISISRDVWAKICTDTWKQGPGWKPVLKLILGSTNNKTRLAVIEWSELEELVDKAGKWDSIKNDQ